MGQLRVGVIAETSLQQHLLAAAVKSHGYDVMVNTSPDKLPGDWLDPGRLDLWLVDVANEDDDFLAAMLDRTDVPILFGLEQAPSRGTAAYPRWERRLFTKVRDMIGVPRTHEQEEKSIKALAEPERVIAQAIALPSELQGLVLTDSVAHVCVLAASLGGPAAVKQFVDCLPAELPVAFVLAQHIDERMLETLANVLARQTRFRVKVAEEGDRLAYGQILLAPVAHEIDFDARGYVVMCDRRWDGPYAPSMDQVISNVARRFGPASGAIIFSGMGGDGSIAGPQLKAMGGYVWGQTAESCACSSQPDSMRATQCVSYNGDPVALAGHLVEQVAAHYRRR